MIEELIMNDKQEVNRMTNVENTDQNQQAQAEYDSFRSKRASNAAWIDEDD